MCAQCMATAVTVGAGATGIRAWIAAKSFSWVTPVRLKRLSAGLVGVAVVVTSVSIG